MWMRRRERVWVWRERGEAGEGGEGTEGGGGADIEGMRDRGT